MPVDWLLRSAAAHVFVDDLEHPKLDEADSHHLHRALRLKPGEVVTVSDGAGRWRSCVLGTGDVLEPTGHIIVEPKPAPRVAVGFAPTKGNRPEWTVQKLTEIGVDLIVPFVADRSVVRWEGERAEKNLYRLRRVAREAAMQSRRVWLSEVAEVTDLRSAIARFKKGQVAVAEPGSSDLTAATTVVFVGPEGGWPADELTIGLNRVGLASTVLRTETAALAAGVLLCAMRGRRVS